MELQAEDISRTLETETSNGEKDQGKGKVFHTT